MWDVHQQNHGENMAKTMGEKTMNTSTAGDTFFGLRLILGRWPVQFIWSVFGTLLDISWLWGEITSLEMAGKQVVGEARIWVMFLLEESLPCVQPLRYLIWKIQGNFARKYSDHRVFFFGMKQNRVNGIHTELFFWTRALKFQRLGRLGTNHTVWALCLASKGKMWR